MILWFGNKKKKEELKKAGEDMSALDASGEAQPIEANAEVQAETEPLRNAPSEVQHAPPAPESLPDAESTRDPHTIADAPPADLSSGPTEPTTEPIAAEEDAEQTKEPTTIVADAAPSESPDRVPVVEPVAEPPPPQAPSDSDATAPIRDAGFFAKLSSGLSKTSSKIGDSVTGLFTRRKLDDEALEDLEDLLLTSDMGAKVAARISANIARTRYDKDISDSELKSVLAEEIEAILKPRERIVDFSEGPRPRVVLFVGVNGSGKTTTIGKIASKLKAQGAKALLVAGDTFRAAAIEQLSVWGERAGIPVLAKTPGADAAGLVYEAVEKARREDLDLVLVDTAGRLQNKTELMSELAKIIRVLRKLDPDAPHDVILVLDATVGQNALSQVEAFRHTAEVSGLVMTKLDGTAKGGVLVAIAEAHDLPIHFVGVGEKAEDLQPFSAQAFARALVGLSDFSGKS